MSWAAAVVILGALAIGAGLVALFVAGDEVVAIVRIVFGRERR